MIGRDRVVSILEDAGLWDRGQVFAKFIRFPCPWRPWLHEKTVGRGGNNYWLDLTDLHGGCFVCDAKSDLWEILMFRGLFTNRPSLVQLAYEVLQKTVDKGKKDTVADAFEAADDKLSKLVDIKEREIVVRRMCDFFDSLPSNPIEAVRYYSNMRKHPFSEDDAREVVSRFNLKFDYDEMRVLQPLFNLYDGKFLGVTGRSVLPDGEVPNKAKMYFGTDKTQTFGVRNPMAFWEAERFIIVEGASSMYKTDMFVRKIDPMTEVLCLNGWKLSDDQIRLLSVRFKPTMLLLDNDKRGKGGMEYALDVLKGVVPNVVKAELPVGVDDPDELKTTDQVKEILKKGLWS